MGIQIHRSGDVIVESQGEGRYRVMVAGSQLVNVDNSRWAVAIARIVTPGIGITDQDNEVRGLRGDWLARAEAARSLKVYSDQLDRIAEGINVAAEAKRMVVHAYRQNTGGGIYCVQVDLDPDTYLLIDEDDSAPGTARVGFYSNRQGDEPENQGQVCWSPGVTLNKPGWVADAVIWLLQMAGRSVRWRQPVAEADAP